MNTSLNESPFLAKMHLTTGVACMLHVPEDLKEICDLLPETVTGSHKLIKHPDFLLAFFTTTKDANAGLQNISVAVHTKTKIWIAYPKAKQLQTDLNRDILRELCIQYGLEAVAIVSINETWSGLRVKLL